MQRGAGSMAAQNYGPRQHVPTDQDVMWVVGATQSDLLFVNQNLSTRWDSPYYTGRPVDLEATVNNTLKFKVNVQYRESLSGISYSLFRQDPVTSMSHFRGWLNRAIFEEGRFILVCAALNFVSMSPRRNHRCRHQALMARGNRSRSSREICETD